MSSVINEKYIQPVKNGDREAVEKLFENLYPTIRMLARNFVFFYSGLSLDEDDLVQEAAFRFFRVMESYDPEKDCLLKTFASKIFENAMMDLVRKVAAEEQHIFSKSEKHDDTEIKNSSIWRSVCYEKNEYGKTPEQIFIEKETSEEIHQAFSKLKRREQIYLDYRYGLSDDITHDRQETADYFHLSRSRSSIIEKNALENLKQELPWWDRNISKKSKGLKLQTGMNV